MKHQVDCRFFEEHLNAYLDSELDQETRSRMISHADNCPDCGERLETMTRLLTMCAELDEGLSVPLDVQSAWRRAVREEAAKGKQRKAPGRGRGIRRTFGSIAAALVLLVGGTFLYRGINVEPSEGMSQTPQVKRSVTATDADYGSFSTGGQSNGDVKPIDMRLKVDGEVTGEPEADIDDDVLTGAYSAPDDVPDQADPDQAGEAREKIILRTAQRSFETSTFDQTVQAIKDLVADSDGYFENESVDGQPIKPGQSYGRHASMTARVATESLGEFLALLDGVATITYKSEDAYDISTNYYDVASRLTSYRLQLDRYNALIATAAGVEDMMLIQEKIYAVQEEIDSLERQIRGWDNSAAQSTVYIDITEIAQRDQQAASASLDERVRGGFNDSVEWVRAFLQDAAVVLAMIAPALVIVIPLAIVIGVIIAAVRRRRRRKNR